MRTRLSKFIPSNGFKWVILCHYFAVFFFMNGIYPILTAPFQVLHIKESHWLKFSYYLRNIWNADLIIHLRAFVEPWSSRSSDLNLSNSRAIKMWIKCLLDSARLLKKWTCCYSQYRWAIVIRKCQSYRKVRIQTSNYETVKSIND